MCNKKDALGTRMKSYEYVTRNYLDRKAQDKRVQQQLAAIKNQAEKATKAAYEAAYKAELAKKAAEAPIEVTIKQW